MSTPDASEASDQAHLAQDCFKFDVRGPADTPTIDLPAATVPAMVYAASRLSLGATAAELNRLGLKPGELRNLLAAGLVTRRGPRVSCRIVVTETGQEALTRATQGVLF